MIIQGIGRVGAAFDFNKESGSDYYQNHGVGEKGIDFIPEPLEVCGALYLICTSVQLFKLCYC